MKMTIDIKPTQPGGSLRRLVRLRSGLEIVSSNGVRRKVREVCRARFKTPKYGAPEPLERWARPLEVTFADYGPSLRAWVVATHYREANDKLSHEEGEK
jgi:hypothetical protein